MNNALKEMELNKLHNIDCLEFMKSMPDKSVDMILTDPPYGDGTGYGRFNKEIANNDDETINYKALPELYRILRGGGVCYLFTNWKFSNKIQEFVAKETQFTTRMQLVVVKNNFGMGYGFRNQYELILVLEKGKVTYNGADVSNVLFMEHINHDVETHPHEKGIIMLKKLIEHSSKPGDIIFDPFAGSGSILVAAKILNRNYIGCEISPEYCKIAEERLKGVTKSMF